MPLISAWHPDGLQRLLIDTDRLRYAPGYPSSLGPEVSRLHLSVWIGDDLPEARLETALVGDRLKTNGATLTAEYDYVVAPHLDYEWHDPFYAWRIVRNRDEKIVYDSLQASETRRLASGGQPVDWVRAVRALQATGELTRPRRLSGIW